jgi:hypothetical protein
MLLEVGSKRLRENMIRTLFTTMLTGPRINAQKIYSIYTILYNI